MTTHKQLEGAGFEVRHPFPSLTCAARTRSSCSTTPERSPTSRTRPRAPHGTRTAGFETVTYLLDGVFVHHDSHGGGGIAEGDTRG